MKPLKIFCCLFVLQVLLVISALSVIAEASVSSLSPSHNQEKDCTIESFIKLAGEYREAGNFEEALKQLNIALKKFPQNEQKEYREKLQIERANVHLQWALNLSEKYDYVNAIKHLEMAYDIDKNYRCKDAANELSRIGLLYNTLGQNQKALGYYEKALPIFQAVGDRAREAETLNHLMFCWNSLKNKPISIFYGKQSVNAYQNLQANISKKDTYRFLAGLLIDEGRLSEAQLVLAMLKEKEYFAFTHGNPSPPTYNQLDFTEFENQWLDKYKKVTKDYPAISSDYYLLKKKKIKSDAEKKRMQELEASLEQYQKDYHQYLAELKKVFDKYD